MAASPAIGQALPRVEDAALLSGRGRYADDLPVSAALAMPGVAAVLTGEDVKRWSTPFVVGVKAPIDCWCLAIDRVRYVGEPVAVVVASDRYRAEDALDAIKVTYAPRPAVVDPRAAAESAAPILHDGVKGNVVSERSFRYGDPEAEFARADHRVAITVDYPRSMVTPIETFVVVAEFDPADEAYDVLANFQGPFTIHPVMARALKVPGNRLRLRTPPDSGGSFGVKQAVFPYIVMMSLAARKAGRPVKWVEDRLEHLTAANSATNRVIALEAAVTRDGEITAIEGGVPRDGEITALRYDQLEDCGAYLRAPEPATLYRMHGNLTGAYKVRHLAVRNRVVLTNKTPTGLNRGFGGPQVYFALERLMQRIAVELKLDPLEVIRRNLIPAGSFPYRCAPGALLDSGDYQTAIRRAVQDGGLAELRARQVKARAEGRLYGIGFAAIVEPSISNMGYITTVLTPEERRRAGPKNGAHASATVAIDPSGSISVSVASVPQGQGHRTVLAQVIADAFGLAPEAVRVNVEVDTRRDAWSIASGNYSSRFAGAVAGTAHLAAMRLRDKLARIAAAPLNVTPDQVQFAGGKVFASGNPDNALSFSRVAGTSHWAPGTLGEAEPALRETAFWTPPQLEAPTEKDEINSSAAYGFIFDFCGVEVERDTGKLRIDRYVTMHDAGTILNPALVDGQIRGGFANAIGAVLGEEFAYAEDGGFLAGTFADYPVPTACEVPEPMILHMETPSPFTPLGAKGVGEGNCMSTPVCLANAVADALGVADIKLPLTPSRVGELIFGEELAPKTAPAAKAAPRVDKGHGRGLSGEGEATVAASPQQVWDVLMDPHALASVLPGCEGLQPTGTNAYRAELRIGVGPVRGRYVARVQMSDLDPPRALTLSGDAEGALGTGAGSGRLTLEETAEGTRVRYAYEVAIGGKVAAVGGRMLDGAARVLIGQFFERLVRRVGGGASKPSWYARLRRSLGLHA